MADHLYGVLGIEPRASREQVERAFRFFLELYGEGSLGTYSLLEPAEAEEQRSRVREAYQVLSDAEKRKAYDEGHGFLPPEMPVLSRPAPGGEGGVGEGARLPTVITGKDLRELREARALSLRHMATTTKIGLRFLEYIEEDRFELLPPTVYLRGFLQEYARLLGLDPKRVAEAYMSRLP
jgi:curved DNA-binding protein CbpA